MTGYFRHILAVQLAQIFAETFAWSFIYLHASQAGHSEAVLAAYFIALFGSAALSITVISRTVPTGRFMAGGLLLKIVGLGIAVEVAWVGSLMASAIVWGVYIMVFWVPYNVVFLRMTSDADRAGKSTFLFALFAVSSAVFPLVGGRLMEWQGFWLLVAISIPVLVIGAWLSSKTPWGEPMRFSLGRALRQGRTVTPLVLLEGIWQGIFWIVLPIGTLRMVDEGSEYGAFLAFLGIMSGVASVLAGRWSDRARDRRLPLVVSSLGVAVFTLIIPFTQEDLTSWSLVVGVTNFFAYMMMAFTFTLVAELGPGIDDSMGLREAMFNLGRVIGGGVFMVTLLLGIDMAWPLVGATVVVLVMLALYIRAIRK